MTHEEALKGIRKKICCEGANRKDRTYHFCTDNCMYGTEQCEIALAMDALEKQIPKKPIDEYEYDFDPARFGRCPMCNEGVNSQMSFCSDCGQALDWSEIDSESEEK